MSTFGRVLGTLGVCLALAGGIGGLAIMPPSGLTRTADYVEEKRAALRAHLPEMPPMQELITGGDGDGAENCAEVEAAREAEGAADACGTAAPKVLGRSGGAGQRLRAPTPLAAD